ncbi:hypothetical protein BO94DRAFT_554883 [Aspergillus sclerotioniger CBS 115572]|uniref:Carrier domain-containing protein n=1 Tax=Aspergillus sclerotioniger CBS 115572 TaxID=1450535 RepID=A0A317X0I0_9EURO|nr:hypothetical protein BO94DRAFT_554883 [Aspergillus sclerotioniger CBS 115572]PWY91671.1 hypothetical protein BO94DRAFT_554883 [Aspergillus sclerotioniger CBS 115572]
MPMNHDTSIASGDRGASRWTLHPEYDPDPHWITIADGDRHWRRASIKDELQGLQQLSSEKALSQLADLLDREDGPWPFQDLLRCYQRVWKGLPEIAKDGSSPEWTMAIDHVQHRLKCVTPHITDLISGNLLQRSLLDPQSGREISHAKVRQFNEDFDLKLPGLITDRKARVAVVLPNGLLLALASLAIAHSYTLVPIAYTAASEELMADVNTAQAEAMLVLEGDVPRFKNMPSLLIYTVQPLDDLTFDVSSVNQAGVPCSAKPAPNGPDDLAIILATSGTSGTKKLVPISMFNLLVMATFTMDSLRLTPESRGLNMMPLRHVGGMMRSLWAPLVAGGTTICCPYFDPNMFWDVVEQYHPTWYYAAPTLHEMIVAEAEHRTNAISRSTITFICNGAAGLSPSLAAKLQNIFRCTVSPSYGMTECVPITAPPPDCDANRTGSSGLAVGPELAIFDTQHPQQHAPPGSVGRICIRGLPLFPGYLTPRGLDRSSFSNGSWFHTGDLGHVDEDGWLYITGRTKEIINRGGETISPVEVEDAIMSAAQDPSSIIFGRVSDALAFSTPHDVLHEVVGVAIALKDCLHQPKWPAVLVYMDALPRSQSKVRRIDLSQRLGLQTLTDHIAAAERHYEADCPPVNTPLHCPIPHRRCEIDPRGVEAYLVQASGMSEILLRAHAVDGYPRAILFRDGRSQIRGHDILALLPDLMHGYLIPSTLEVVNGPIPRDTHGVIDEAAVQAKLHALYPAASSPIQQQVSDLFAAALNSTPEDMTPATDFLESGGDSLRAGRLISQLRQEFQAPLAVDALFRSRTIGAMTAVIKAATADLVRHKASIDELAVQLAMGFICPLLGIALKWLLVGRYKAGMYPMWGPYHMRWWLTQKVLQVCGKGVFNRYNWSRVLYYQALGTHIGRGVQIDESTALGEYDLIHIGDGVVLEHCLCRPFASERNTSMLLQSISIGANCYVGIRSSVVPGTTLLPGTCIGPNSCTWEVDDADESHRDLASAHIPQPHWIWQILVVTPMEIVVAFASALPRLAGLLPIVSRYPTIGEDRLRHTVLWLTNSTRIGYFLLMRLYSSLAGPIIWFLTVVAVKHALDAVCGRPQRGSYGQLPSAQRVRHAVVEAILPLGDISQLARIVGPHYELVSVAVRMLGGRVGKRVYWPRTGLKLTPDFDLVDIGNDVVFGSQSYLITADGTGREPIVIGDGAMLGDRAVVLPGVTVGTRTMVGSGSLLRRNGLYPDDNVWTGSKHGDAIRFPQIKGTFYQGLANYHVLGMGSILGYSNLVVAFTAVYSMVVPLAGLFVLGRLLQTDLLAFEMRWWRPFAVYGMLATAMAAVTLVQTVVSLAMVIATKWLLLGRRQEGSYPIMDDSFGGIGILPSLGGTAYLCWFYRAMGATIGADCALAANGDPHILLTEPDLVTLGDRVTVDDASLFELHLLRVGDRSVLRTGSRLLSGASMGADACLLEHTLVLSGDHVDDGGTMQGWPAEPFMGDRLRRS